MIEIMHIKKVYSNFRNFNLIKNSFKLTWNTHRSNYSTVSKYKKEEFEELIHKIRSFGVIAHVDAGKTTTTERMLFYSGFIKNLGNVDDGNTVTDYMEQERERGITIVSAAITFPWKTHQFNLIDTPGHVDFNIEVERSLRVLDGAVTIIDASAGVEAQTLSVWRQSNKYKIPRIVYINKMDKFGANFEESLKSIESKLQTNPLPVQLPIGREKTFSGLIDLINMKKLIWDQNSQDESTSGKKYEVNDLDKNDSFYERAFKHRLNLIEKLAQANEQFAEILLDKYNLNYEKVDDNLLLESFIRQSCLNNTITPVLCGSSFKNIGVQPLMDAIVKYLPHPLDLEKNNFQKFFENSKTFVGLCFKIIHDHLKMRKRINPSTNTASLQTSISSLPQNSNTKTRIDEAKSDEDNSLCFIRVYNGELQNKAKLFNVNRQCREEVDKIYIPYSNQIKTVNKISNGNIALISGLSKMTITGDLLVSSKQDYDKAHEKVLKASQKEDDENAKLIEASIDIPSSVFFCTVEPESDAEEKRLNFALSCLEREDPSLKVLKNEEENLGQTIIQGMGELHLEIIKDRLLREYKLKAYFGPLNIAYKEMPTKQSSELFTFERSINEKKNFVQIELEILPKLNHRFESVQLNLRPNSENKGFQNNREFPVEYLESINNGVRSALNKGILLRYPMVNVDVRLNSFNANSKIHLPYISSAAYGCTTRALQKAECVVTQPIMQLEIATTKDYSSKVYGDLSRRNALNIYVHELNQNVNISASVPLAQLHAYSSELRRLTSGNTTFTIEFKKYDTLSQKEYQDLLEKKNY